MTNTGWLVANASSYPRVGDTPALQRLRRTQDQFDKGRKAEEELRAAQDDMTRAAVEEQIEAGCDLVTDGLVRWYDAISHPMRNLPPVEIDGLLRFFDTNTYFRQPVLRGRVVPAPLGLLPEYRFAAQAAGKIPVKPVITGPYTLAALSIRKHSPYADVASLAADLATVVAEEIERLAKAGAMVIQVDEPAILRQPADIGILAKTVPVLSERKHEARLALVTYFGDAAPLYERLQELPVDILGFDLTYGDRLPDVIARSGSARELALGCVDARNTRLESAKDVASRLGRLRKAVGGRRAYLTPSAGLEYLPRQRAFDKLRLLAEVKALLAGG